jgi:hypothetical protein
MASGGYSRFMIWIWLLAGWNWLVWLFDPRVAVRQAVVALPRKVIDPNAPCVVCGNTIGAITVTEMPGVILPAPEQGFTTSANRKDLVMLLRACGVCGARYYIEPLAAPQYPAAPPQVRQFPAA